MLIERPGLSGVELSRAMGVQESSSMRNVKLLMEKGIVAKILMPDGKIAYSINSDYRTYAVSASPLPLKKRIS